MKPDLAFILGAGLGTRLRPLTEARPKPLVPIFGKPLITFAFDHLIAAGISEFVVNTHHRPDAYEKILGGDGLTTTYHGCSIRFRHEAIVLETGGGIHNARDLIGDRDFVVYNGDVLADFPLERALEMHERSGNLATLVLRSSGGPLQVRCDPATGLIHDFRDTIGGRSEPSFLFTGITVLSPQIFDLIPAGKVISIVPVYLDAIRNGKRIGGCVIDEGHWFDIGSRASYLEIHRWLLQNHLSYLPATWPDPVHPRARIAPGARLEGCVAIGRDAVIGDGAVVTDSIIWENATVAPGAELDTCVVRDNRRASGSLAGAVI